MKQKIGIIKSFDLSELFCICTQTYMGYPKKHRGRRKRGSKYRRNKKRQKKK